jgi:hypothetical protein
LTSESFHHLTNDDAEFSPTDAIWHALARVPGKRDYFAADVSFRLSIADAQAELGPLMAEKLHQIALLIIKPETILARRSNDVLSILSRSGFGPIWWDAIRLTAIQAREIWRYSWSEATLARIYLAESLAEAAPSLFIVVRTRAVGLMPATVQLGALKGQVGAKVEGETLRSASGARNQVLSCVHVSDEPADVIRELGVVLGVGARAQAYRAIHTASVDWAGLMAAAATVEDEAAATILPSSRGRSNECEVVGALQKLSLNLKATQSGAELLALVTELSEKILLDRIGVPPQLDGGPQKYWVVDS